ncbi:hypothetical protein P7G17_13540, partial [Enterococcus faecalis]|nr:hypothetical protein [Enterococcus faecalis]
SSFLLLSFSIILPYLIVDLKLCNRTFDTMSVKVEKLLLELTEEVLRVQPKTKQEYREMVARYSFRNGEN